MLIFFLIKKRNNMKKLSIFLLSIIFGTILIYPASAFDNMAVTAYAGYYMPQGNAGNVYNSSWGFEGQFEYKFTESIAADVTAGYIKWNFGTQIPGASFTMIPMLIGGRYYFPMPGFTPYGGVDFGMYNSNFKSNFTPNSSVSKFGYAILAGAIFPFSGFNVNANLDYTSVSLTQTFSYLVVHVGVSYPF
jgi:hypothetical protein